MRTLEEEMDAAGEADLLEHVYTEAEKEFLLRIIKTKIAPILEGLA